MSEEPVVLEFSQAEALVLFEFLARFSQSESLAIEDKAEQRVLWDMQCMLEKTLTAPLMSNYLDLLTDARDRVRDKAH
jgi:hypothetical protein